MNRVFFSKQVDYDHELQLAKNTIIRRILGCLHSFILTCDIGEGAATEHSVHWRRRPSSRVGVLWLRPGQITQH